MDGWVRAHDEENGQAAQQVQLDQAGFLRRGALSFGHRGGNICSCQRVRQAAGGRMVSAAVAHTVSSNPRVRNDDNGFDQYSSAFHWFFANLVLHLLSEAAAMYSGLSSPLYILSRGFRLTVCA